MEVWLRSRIGRGQGNKCVSICISKHGILTAKRPLVSGNAPNTPPHGKKKRGDFNNG